MTKRLSKEEFKKLLNKYEQAYYSGESLISDEEYDALKEDYVKKYGEYNFVPDEGETGFERVNHLHPLLSLDKVQLSDEKELRKRLEKLWPVAIQPKFDGLSIEIQPNLKFITRGNGQQGDDVTAQCMQIPNIELLSNLLNDNNTSLRAEVVMTHSSFNVLNEQRINSNETPFSNCRNAAAGMLRNLDLNKVKGLTIIIYEKLGSTDKESKVIDDLIASIDNKQLELIKDNIRITPIYKPDSIDDAINYLKGLEEFRESIDYDIDGWVVKSDIEDSLKVHGGYTGHHPKNAFAVKGEAKGEWTRLKSVTWQVGKENITPVAELEPVFIDGSTISRATLHNISIMKALGLTKIISENGETLVHVVKANDVIPKIINVTNVYYSDNVVEKEIIAPNTCPVCNHVTQIKDTDSDSEILICPNIECGAKIQSRAEQMASREAFDINGLSEKTISKILDTFDVNDVSEILNINVDEILLLEGYAQKSAEQLYNSIQKAIKKQTLDKVIYASGIPLIGKDASKLIAKRYKANELSNILLKPDTQAIKELCEIKGIGKETATAFVKYKNLYESMSAVVNEIVDIAIPKSDIKQKTFCITGQREPFKSIIENAGHKVSGSVSKKTVALIDSSLDLSTTKALKAKELNIPIISTEEELKELL